MPGIKVIAICAFVFSCSCSGSSPPIFDDPNGGDSDSDSDTDSDSDSDSDTDSDSDSDTDTDSDTDSDTDTGDSLPVEVDPDGWSCFEEDIASCDSGGSCTTADVVDICEDHETGDYVSGPDSLHVYSGATGYCGTGGLEQDVTVPDAPTVFLSFWTKASADYWAGHAGVQLVEGTAVDWLKDYNGAQSDWVKGFADVSAWAGQAVTLRLVVEDMSSAYCDMFDHSYRIYGDDFWFTASDSKGR